MSKIVCDVCGSSYSETEAQCPICGTAKSEQAQPATEPTGEEQAQAGKFSKTTTRKTGTGAAARQTSREKTEKSGKEGPSNVAMMIVVGVLLLAIVAVCVFIAVSVGGNDDPTDPIDTVETTDPTTDPTGDNQPGEIACEGIELDESLQINGAFQLNALTESVQLVVNALPANTTENVTFEYSSSNTGVAIVSDTGKITPVASGEAQITVTYGEYSLTVTVVCNIPVEVPTLALADSIKTSNGYEFSLGGSNPTYQDMYDLIVNKSSFTQSELVITSEDESVVRVEGTKVVAVSKKASGVYVTVTYGDQEVKCLVRVYELGEAGYRLQTGYQTGAPTIDVYLYIGKEGYESFRLWLCDGTGAVVTDLTWEFSDDCKDCCSYSVTDGVVTITALKDSNSYSGGYVRAYVKYGSATYTCRIFIDPASEG